MITHPFFGEFADQDLQGDAQVVWEKFLTVANKPVNVHIWVRNLTDFSQEKLDKIADFCQSLDKFDQLARQALLDELEQDDSYMTEHFNEIQPQIDSPILAKLIAENATKSQFATTMQLESISIWLFQYESDDTERTFIMDYKIDPELSDEILAVNFDINGKLVYVAWES